MKDKKRVQLWILLTSACHVQLMETKDDVASRFPPKMSHCCYSGHLSAWISPLIAKTFSLIWSRFINQAEFDGFENLHFQCVLNLYLISLNMILFCVPNFRAKVNWKHNFEHPFFCCCIHLIFDNFHFSKFQVLKFKLVKTFDSHVLFLTHTHIFVKSEKILKVKTMKKFELFTYVFPGLQKFDLFEDFIPWTNLKDISDL